MRLHPRNLALSIALVLPLCAQSEPTVFPVQGIFFKADQDSNLDPALLRVLSNESLVQYGRLFQAAMQKAFAGRVQAITSSNAGSTFAVSINISRAKSYSVDKKNGTVDLLASITGSVYFTNIVSGDILLTVSESLVKPAKLVKKDSYEEDKDKLFAEALNSLIQDLAADAPKQFNVTTVNVKVEDKVGNLLLLDSGFRQGIQVSDTIENASGELIEVVYAAEDYSVAMPVIVNAGFGPGATFQKYLSQAVQGQFKPRTVVVPENLPAGFGAEYISQLFSELLGKAAPVSVVQVNPQFGRLVRTVAEQSNLSLNAVSSRKEPEFFIRLRVPEPLIYEAPTNLDFHSIHHAEASAFGDVVDSSGRVRFSAVGHDVIHEDVVNNIAPSRESRRDVVVKNALLDLAKKLAAMGEPTRERVDVINMTDSGAITNAAGKFMAAGQPGLVIRKAQVSLRGKPASVWIPVSKANVDINDGGAALPIALTLPLDPSYHVPAGTQFSFEISTLGVTPRSSTTFSICDSVESKGKVPVPALSELASFALAQQMPGVLYAPDMVAATTDLISPLSGFDRSVSWTLPTISGCVQAVDRVSVDPTVCTERCDSKVTAAILLRLKKGDEVRWKSGLETKFNTSSFYQAIAPDALKSLIDIDLAGEASSMLNQITSKAKF